MSRGLMVSALVFPSYLILLFFRPLMAIFLAMSALSAAFLVGVGLIVLWIYGVRQDRRYL